MAKYKCIYDGDSFIDGIECEDLESAQNYAKDILIEWLAACPDDDIEKGMMVNNCMTWVEKLDEESGEWEEVWYPEDEWLHSIGWVDPCEDEAF